MLKIAYNKTLFQAIHTHNKHVWRIRAQEKRWLWYFRENTV